MAPTPCWSARRVSSRAQMTNDAFVRHYTAVADASPVPVLLYNFTAVTGVNLLPAAVARLATHPNIIGMKESGGDVAQVARPRVADAGRLQRARRRGGDALSDDVRRRGGRHPRAGLRRCRTPCMRLFELTQRRPPRRGARAAAPARAGRAPARRDARRAGPEGGAATCSATTSALPRPPLAPLPEAIVAALRDALAQFEEIPA